MTFVFRPLGLALVLLAFAGSAAGAAKVLNGKQLQQLLFGNTLIGQTEWADAEWHAYVDLEGRIHIKGSRPSGAYEFFGQVTIEHDRWCEKWQIKNDEKRCRQITRDGNRFDVLRDDGHVISTFTVRAGDVNGYGGPSLVAAVPAPPPPSPDGASDTTADQPAASDQSSPPADAGTGAATADQPAASDQSPAPTDAGTGAADQPAANAPAAPAGESLQPAAPSPPTEIATKPPAETAPAGSAPISLGLPQHNSAIALTNDAIIGWHRQGVDDATIVSLIKQSATAFDLSPKALEVLDKAGITKTVIAAMLAADLAK